MSFVRTRVLDPLLTLLKQGMSPQRLAWSLALGIVIGVFPVIGTTTLLCTAAALALRLNIGAMQLANYLVFSLQVAMILPWIRLGEQLLGALAGGITPSDFVATLQASPWTAISRLRDVALCAITAWALAAPLLAVALYFALLPALRALARSRAGSWMS